MKRTILLVLNALLAVAPLAAAENVVPVVAGPQPLVNKEHQVREEVERLDQALAQEQARIDGAISSYVVAGQAYEQAPSEVTRDAVDHSMMAAYDAISGGAARMAQTHSNAVQQMTAYAAGLQAVEAFYQSGIRAALQGKDRLEKSRTLQTPDLIPLTPGQQAMLQEAQLKGLEVNLVLRGTEVSLQSLQALESELGLVQRSNVELKAKLERNGKIFGMYSRVAADYATRKFEILAGLKQLRDAIKTQQGFTQFADRSDAMANRLRQTFPRLDPATNAPPATNATPLGLRLP